jgi:hypothetical protein
MTVVLDKKRRFFGQVTMEFTFGMVGAVFLLVGMIRVFAWIGKDLIARQDAHQASFNAGTCGNTSCPLSQLQPTFFSASEMEATINSNVFGDQYP